jgi:16S rRNA (uracil1498-N3)-methyltransferase
MAQVPILYVPDVSDEELTLPEDEGRHAIKVLRSNEGDELRLVDGRGGIYRAFVQRIDKKDCVVRIADELQGFGQRPYRLTLAVAPTKNDQRFEWFLEKATEMGIDRIVPLIGARSEKERTKPERFRKILIAAMKQSNKAYLPELEDPVPFGEFLERIEDEQAFIAHCYQEPQRTPLKDAYEQGGNVTIMIGPEGDFTPQEVEEAMEGGVRPVSLGKAVLRTETAAVAACHTIALMNQE